MDVCRRIRWGAAGVTAAGLLVLAWPGELTAQTAVENPPQAGAQEDGSRAVRPLTADQAVRIALDRNPQQRAAKEGVRAAAAAVGEARAPYYPAVDLQAGYHRWETPAFLPDGILPAGRSDFGSIGPTNDWSVSVGGTVLLHDGGRRAANLRAALAGSALADHERLRLREDLALEVRRAFYAVAAALDGVTVAEANLARAREHVRLARARKEAGAVPGGDVIQAEVQVADARPAQVHVVSRLTDARGHLNTAMGLPVWTDFDLVKDTTPLLRPDVTAVEAAMTEAASLRPSRLAALDRVDAATAAVSAARSQFRPRIAAEWAAGLRDDDLGLSRPDWRVGVTVNWSIFDGFARRHRVARARAEEARARAEAEGIEQSVRREVWSAHARLVEAHESLESTAVLVRDAAEGVRVARERYRAGAGTVNELLDAETALARAASLEAQARWDRRTAQAVANWAAGKSLVPASVQEP